MKSSLSVPTPLTDSQISAEEKRYRVKKLVRELRDDLDEINLLPFERNAHMEQLKVFGRNPDNADALFTPEGIQVLTHHGFHTTSATTSKAALECLANALLAKPRTRQMFVDLGYSERVVTRLKKPKSDDEFLMSRILFLTSYGTSQSFEHLIAKHHLADYLNDNMERHAKNKHPTTHDDAALGETAKLIFSITHLSPGQAPGFSKSVQPIMRIIARRPLSNPPLQEPTNLLVNALMNLSLSDKKVAANKDLKPCMEKLIDILSAAFTTYEDSELDSTVTPLLKLIKRLVKISPSSLISYLKSALLPPPALFAPPTLTLGSLPQRLVAHLKNPTSISLHDAITSLHLTLLDGNIDRLRTDYAIPVHPGAIKPLGPPHKPKISRTHSSNSSMTSASAVSARSVEASPFTPANPHPHPHTSPLSPPPPGGGSTKSVSHTPQSSQSSSKSTAAVETEKLMMLFDQLKVTSISSYEDPRMKKAARDMVIELQPEED